ncbi:MAG: DUF3459 domain-containing protein, partial [Myxococcota bacterium]
RLRRQHVVPLLASGWMSSESSETDGLVEAHWAFNAGSLRLQMNVGERDQTAAALSGRPLYASPAVRDDTLPPWSLRFSIEEA